MTVMYAPETAYNYLARQEFWRAIQLYHNDKSGTWRRGMTMPDWMLVELAMRTNVEVQWALNWGDAGGHIEVDELDFTQ
jgi:hypothetical protein